MLPDLFGDFYSEVIRGIDRQARLNKYQTLLSSSHASSHDVLQAGRAMLGRIDGLIMMAPDENTIDIVERIRRRVPVVLLNPRGEVPRCHRVAVQNYEGARAATEHLLSLGHRRIALIAGPEGNVDAEERHRGFRDSLADAGLDPEAALVVPGDFSEMAGYEAALRILGHQPRPSAVFACNDAMAVGLLSAVGRAGKRVPEDLAVVGFDNIDIAEYLNPALTTVHVDACNLGRHAVDLMLSTIEAEGPVPPVLERMPAVLTIRRSCGAHLSQEETNSSGDENAARFRQ
ncbi:LacI family transcriptional regulator [bacterium DOLZORAL124_64_63]|nr:MAG: LacI family transcriptional regulator [bacterium DOLZORAL124_64_63]